MFVIALSKHYNANNIHQRYDIGLCCINIIQNIDGFSYIWLEQEYVIANCYVFAKYLLSSKFPGDFFISTLSYKLLDTANIPEIIQQYSGSKSGADSGFPVGGDNPVWEGKVLHRPLFGENERIGSCWGRPWIRQCNLLSIRLKHVRIHLNLILTSASCYIMYWYGLMTRVICRVR